MEKIAATKRNGIKGTNTATESDKNDKKQQQKTSAEMTGASLASCVLPE